MAKSKKNRRRISKKMLLIWLVVVLVAAFAAWRITEPKPVKQKPPEATITNLPSKSSAPPEKTPSTPSSDNQGTATNAPAQTVTTSPDQWTSSQSGVIVVKTPLNNSTIQSGAILSGTSSASTIQYRLIDDNVGVISEGPITVNSGKFSVSISFQAHAQTGRLDVFTTNSAGVESSEVQLGVRF